MLEIQKMIKKYVCQYFGECWVKLCEGCDYFRLIDSDYAEFIDYLDSHLPDYRTVKF